MKTITIPADKAIEAYNKADSSTKQIIAELVGKENVLQLDVEERFKELCKKINVNYDEEYSADRLKYFTADEIAYRKMKHICLAYNEGVVLDFNDANQRKYYPWFKYVAGRGLSLYVVSFDGVYTTVTARLTFKSEAVCRQAVADFFPIYEIYFSAKSNQ